MSDHSNAPADLSSPGIDLSDMFRPAWTTESADSAARLAAKYDGEERPGRFGGGGRREHTGGRDERGPRPGGGGRPERPNRPQSPKGRREGEGRESRGAGGARREHDGRRGHRAGQDHRPEQAPKPVLEGWKLELVPDPAAIEGIAKQIRSRAKAYPLFELARLIVQLSDRYSVRLHAENEETPELFRVKADGSLWQTSKEAVSHLLARHLGTFYRKSTVTTEPPKGAFSVVAQCGMSGVVLGPPNHHEYTAKLIALHTERFRNMPFEVYKARIRMMRDEALIEQWKTEQSTKTVYTPLSEGAPEELRDFADTSAESAPEGAAEAPPEAAPITETPQPEIPGEGVQSAGDQAGSTEGAVPEGANEDDSSPLEATPGKAPEEAGPGVKGVTEGLTLEQVPAHFNEHHAEREIELSGHDVILGGRAALHGSTPLLRGLLLRNLQELDRFPLPLAQVLGRELTIRGLQLFKSHKKIINVSVARPRYLDRELTPIRESLRAILEYLEAHPKQNRDRQWTALLALRTETSEQPDPQKDLGPPGEPPGTEQPAGTAKPAINEETLKRREQALGADLLWLLHQGHIIDFAMGNLQAATRPAPKAQTGKGADSQVAGTLPEAESLNGAGEELPEATATGTSSPVISGDASGPGNAVQTKADFGEESASREFSV